MAEAHRLPAKGQVVPVVGKPFVKTGRERLQQPLPRRRRPEVPGKGSALLVQDTRIPEVKLLVPRRFPDGRGFFAETWSARRMAEHGLDFHFVQDNHSYSAQAGTVRGLHFQAPPMAQTKLVRVSRGAVLDVAVDIRKGSPTFGQYVVSELSAENGAQLLVPQGFLHGYRTLVDHTDVLYKVDAFYAPETEGSVRYDDPEIAINWGPDPETVTLSDKDAAAPAFRDFDSPFTYGV